MNDAYREMDADLTYDGMIVQATAPRTQPPNGSSPTSDEAPTGFGLDETEDFGFDRLTHVVDEAQNEGNPDGDEDEPTDESDEPDQRPRLDLDARL
jgi:hypothetical protein